MHATLSLRLLATFIAFGVSALAQADWAGFATGLRSKYGPPLLRETFAVKPALEMVVDYAANGNVCRIQLPPMGPDLRPGVQSGQAIDNFLAELLPLTMRGKEQRRFLMATGAPSVSIVEYENVTIAENFQGDRRTGVTATFTKEQCRDQAAP
jgi:hypothetical protein